MVYNSGEKLLKFNVYSAYLFRGSSFEKDNEELAKQEKKLEYDPYCPMHGSRRRLNRRRLVTMQSIMSSVDQDDHEAELAILCRFSAFHISEFVEVKIPCN